MKNNFKIRLMICLVCMVPANIVGMLTRGGQACALRYILQARHCASNPTSPLNTPVNEACKEEKEEKQKSFKEELALKKKDLDEQIQSTILSPNARALYGCLGVALTSVSKRSIMFGVDGWQGKAIGLFDSYPLSDMILYTPSVIGGTMMCGAGLAHLLFAAIGNTNLASYGNKTCQNERAVIAAAELSTAENQILLGRRPNGLFELGALTLLKTDAFARSKDLNLDIEALKKLKEEIERSSSLRSTIDASVSSPLHPAHPENVTSPVNPLNFNSSEKNQVQSQP